MNNTKSNNPPLQVATPSSSITLDTASTTINTSKAPRSSGHESSSFQRRRRSSGRSANQQGRVARQGGHPVQEVKSTLVGSPNHDSSTTAATDATELVHDTSSRATKNASEKTTSNRGHHRANAKSTGSGKYRQRQHTSQLIEGMESLTGLGIELAETIVPTSSSTGRDSDTNKRRHATNSRKVNLTHLLNYKYERPRSRGNNRYGGQTFNQRTSSSHYRDSGSSHKFNKQQFLQANCQFVVAVGHDYTIHKVDPDWPMDWNCIEEVRFMQSASTETTCPICLEPPTAAKITRCGHIYCWTCMLHYLSLSDEKRRQCPICFEPVCRSDLRSVISHSFTNYSVDEEITMRLMIRKKGCVEVEPYSKGANLVVSPSADHSLPHGGPDSHYWSRANLVIVDPETVVSKIAQRERDELEFKLSTDGTQPEVCFVEQALGLLEERVNCLLDRTTEAKAKSKDSQAQVNDELFAPTLSSYLFYQCVDGQHIYLNPFSTKVLCHEYGSLENSPLDLKSKILQMDWISMNEAWRKRFRYLSHLPLTCEFRLIEIDFEKSNLVSPATYKIFEDQILWRKQERENRRREERKRDKKIQVQQDRKIYGIQPSLKVNLDSIDQFPSVSDERYLDLSLPAQATIDQEDFYSSDETDLIETGEPSPTTDQQTTAEANGEELPEEAVTKVTTSFRDIQLQEAALEVKQKSNKALLNQSAWCPNRSGTSSNNQSSFAQLLLDAKSSQKQWTRNATSLKVAQTGPTSAGQTPSTSHNRNRLTSGSAEEEEELRAPPFECTISDFIDMNVVSNKKKGKKKSR